MTTLFKSPLSVAALALAALSLAAPAVAQVTFYEHDNFQGRSVTADRNVRNLENFGFNDLASSVVVTRGDRWEVCEEARFAGRCVVLRQGQYPSLGSMGLNDRISSMRMLNGNSRIEQDRYAPQPAVAQDWRRRRDERLFEVEVSSVRAVMGTPEQRCWVEQEQVSSDGRSNAPGAVLGAVIGGILGHQVGGGSGRDLATAGGVVAGAVVGSNVSRNRQQGSQQGGTQDVQRCAEVRGQNRVDHWDVAYNFRGVDHRVQMTTRPGRTILVNRQGEPRV